MEIALAAPTHTHTPTQRLSVTIKLVGSLCQVIVVIYTVWEGLVTSIETNIGDKYVGIGVRFSRSVEAVL
jgi:hypothetical protein